MKTGFSHTKTVSTFHLKHLHSGTLRKMDQSIVYFRRFLPVRKYQSIASYRGQALLHKFKKLHDPTDMILICMGDHNPVYMRNPSAFQIRQKLILGCIFLVAASAVHKENSSIRNFQHNPVTLSDIQTGNSELLSRFPGKDKNPCRSCQKKNPCRIRPFCSFPEHSSDFVRVLGHFFPNSQLTFFFFLYPGCHNICQDNS